MVDCVKDFYDDEDVQDEVSPLSWACEHYRYEFCRMILDVSVETIDRGWFFNGMRGKYNQVEYFSCLEKSAFDNDVELCRLLLEYGANLSAGEVGAWTLSAKYGSIEICQLLLEHGIDLNGMDDCCQTALCVASQWGRVEVVKFLLAQDGINVDLGGKYLWGYSSGKEAWDISAPFLSAANGCHVEICRLLAEHGANVFVENKDQNNALEQYLRWHNISCNIEMVKLLVGLGLGTPGAFFMAVNDCEPEIIQVFVDHDPDIVNSTDEDTMTVYHYTMDGQDKDSMKWLLSQPGIRFNIIDNNGNTPLDVAYQKDFRMFLVYVLIIAEVYDAYGLIYKN